MTLQYRSGHYSEIIQVERKFCHTFHLTPASQEVPRHSIQKGGDVSHDCTRCMPFSHSSHIHLPHRCCWHQYEPPLHVQRGWIYSWRLLHFLQDHVHPLNRAISSLHYHVSYLLLRMRKLTSTWSSDQFHLTLDKKGTLVASSFFASLWSCAQVTCLPRSLIEFTDYRW